MSKRVPKSKRLQVINKWLRGIEDDVYEVYPTRTEGKYIVRPRKEPLVRTSAASSEAVPEPETEPEPEAVPELETKPECLSVTEQIPKPTSECLSVAKPKIKRPPIIQPQYDPTINIEILNQLKLLGEEIKSKREKKEQKRMIKEVVHKQLTKPRREINYNYTDPQYIQPPNIEPQQINETECLGETNRLTYRRRNTIFSDIL
ncbi:hypothetical protein M9Y10_013776 [Tritrichomonas musculus]|uniref:Uncharacterized protein n=1 Tax=Tritrichomonas musculus TaxID=1915356 RepID=A0ABR2KXS4_9EUKA